MAQQRKSGGTEPRGLAHEMEMKSDAELAAFAADETQIPGQREAARMEIAKRARAAKRAAELSTYSPEWEV